jgi:hypothetical protein
MFPPETAESEANAGSDWLGLWSLTVVACRTTRDRIGPIPPTDCIVVAVQAPGGVGGGAAEVRPHPVGRLLHGTCVRGGHQRLQHTVAATAPFHL